MIRQVTPGKAKTQPHRRPVFYRRHASSGSSFRKPDEPDISQLGVILFDESENTAAGDGMTPEASFVGTCRGKMPVTRHPPPRSVREVLPHTAPTLSIWRRTAPTAEDV